MVYEDDPTKLPRKRQIAKQLGYTHYFTGKICKNGHICPRRTTDGNCNECTKMHRRKKYEKNPEKYKQKYHEYYEKNKESISATKKNYYEKNKHKWYELNKAKRANMLNSKLYRLHRLEVYAIYQRCRAMNEADPNNIHEVDHIYPIVGEGFCGLHVPWNLRIIPWLENRKKSNRFPEGELL